MIFSAVWDKFVYCSLRSGQREACTGNPTRYLVCGESNGLCYCTSHQDLLCVSCGAANVWILPWLRYLVFHYTSYISLLTEYPKRIVPSRSSRDSDRAGPSLIPPLAKSPLLLKHLGTLSGLRPSACLKGMPPGSLIFQFRVTVCI